MSKMTDPDQIARGPRGRASKTQCQRCGHHNGKHSGDCSILPRTIEEIARGIAEAFSLELTARACESSEQEPMSRTDCVEYLTEKIATALREYGEVRYREGCVDTIHSSPNYTDDIKEAERRGWNERERIMLEGFKEIKRGQGDGK